MTAPAAKRLGRRLAQSGLALVLLASVAPAAALAQTTTAQTTTVTTNSLEEIVVTAPRYVATRNLSGNKIDVPLIETPQAISVINRDQIDLLNWTSLQQVVRYTAGVVGENYGPDERYDWLTVRGFYPIQYVDGLQAPIGSVTNVGLDLYGSDSVELLKGPSSGLYGSAPPGGIVNMTSRRPQKIWGGEVGVQYGSYDHKQAQGDVTGPINDNVAFRMTGLIRDRDTQTDGVRSKRQYAAPAVSFDLTDKTKLTLLNYFQYDKIRGDGGGFLPSKGTVLPNPFGQLDIGFNAGDYKYNYYKRRQYGVGYDFSHEFNSNFTFRQNLKYFLADSASDVVYGAGLQADNRTLNRYRFAFDEKVASFNVDNRGEIRVETGALRHTLLVGMDYRRVANTSDSGFSFGPTLDLFNPKHEVPVAGGPGAAFLRQVQRQTGVYVQDAIKLDRWILTVGGRQDWVKSKNFGVPTKDDKFTYRVGLNYVFESGLAPYAVYSTSFQPTSGADFSGTAFRPTTGHQVEGGLKYEPSDLPKGVKAFGTVAAFALKQQNVLTNDPDPTHAFLQVQQGEVEVKGIEFELNARLYEQISLNASYTYSDPEVTKSNGPDLHKDLLSYSRHKLAAFVDYTFTNTALRGLGAGVGVRYTSSLFGDPANLWKTTPKTLFDAIVHYDYQQWRIALNGSNLFDKKYYSRCSSADQCFPASRGFYTVSVTKKF